MEYYDSILLKRPEKKQLNTDQINFAIQDINRKMVDLNPVK